MRDENDLRRRLISAAAVALSIFVVDCLMPRSVALGAGYIAVIVMISYGTSARLVYVAGAACSLLIVAVYLVPAHYPGHWVEPTERVFTLAALWAVTWLAAAHTKAESRASRQGRELTVTSAELAGAEKKYRLILSNISDSVLMTDDSGAFTYVSPSVSEIFGYSENEIAQFGTLSELFGDSLPIPRGNARSSEIRNVEHTITDKYGRKHTLLTHTKRVAIGNSSLLFASRDITERKAAEKQSLEANQLLEAMFASLREAVLVVRAKDRTILRCNPVVETVFGYTPGELCQQTTRILYESDERYEEGVRVRDEAMRASGVSSAEVQLRRKDGRLIDVESTVSPFTTPGGEVCLVAVVRDVTERKHAEEALQRQNEVLQSIFDHAPVMVVFIDPTGRIAMVNREWERVLGWSHQEVVEEDLFPELYPDAAYRACVATYIRKGAGTFADFRTRRRDGRVIDTSWANVLLSDGTSVGIGVDITQRKRSEEAFRNRGELLQTIFDHAPVMMVYMDDSRTIRLINREFEKVLGYSMPDVQEPDFWATIYPDEGERKRAWEYIQRGERSRAEFRVRAKDGADLQTTWLNAVLSDGTAIGIGEDITERKRDEIRRRQQEAELARVTRLTSVGELASGVAHELNQPLTAVINYAAASRRLIESGTVNDEVLQVLEKASEQAHRASEIVGWLSGFVRREEKPYRPVDVNEAVRQAVRLVSSDAEAADLRVLLDLDNELPRVHGDDIQLQQVILNLTRNGVEAMVHRRKGRQELHVTTRRADARSIVVAVRDFGPGLTPEALARVFEPFHTTKPGGLGMGLSISRSIISAHGGRLWASNSPDGGATFQFTVPIYREDDAHDE